MYVSAAQQTCKSVAEVGLCQACSTSIAGSEKSFSNWPRSQQLAYVR